MTNQQVTVDELIGNFQLEPVRTHPIMQHWHSASYPLDDFELERLRSGHPCIQEFAHYWNEAELKIQFISTLLEVSFRNTGDLVKPFFGRSFSTTNNGWNPSVRCDCMLAESNCHKPRTPWFILQVFKKGKDYDPEAGMLAAMLQTRLVNEPSQPVFGGWVFKEHWRFAMLENKEYCTSQNFDSTNWNELLQIAFHLRHVKELVLNPGNTVGSRQ